MSVVVTRHKALVALLVEQGVIKEDARVLEHVTIEDVKGQHVIGVLLLKSAGVRS